MSNPIPTFLLTMPAAAIWIYIRIFHGAIMQGPTTLTGTNSAQTGFGGMTFPAEIIFSFHGPIVPPDMAIHRSIVETVRAGRGVEVCADRRRLSTWPAWCRRGETKMKMPKTIVEHPGVQECTYGPASGVDEYRYDVFLKPGWSFTSGRSEGVRSGHFNNVDEFRSARPMKAAGGAP